MDVRDTISGIMNLPKTEIGNISEVKKGMTNQSFLFSCDGEEYILRIPGVGTSMLIDRKREAAVYNVLKDSDLCDHIIYFNKETGYKISRFYRNACVCNAGNDNDLKRCMVFLRNFHQIFVHYIGKLRIGTADAEPDKRIKTFWAVVFILFPIALIFSEESMYRLQSVSIIAAFPIGIVIVLIIISFFKDAHRILHEK